MKIMKLMCFRLMLLGETGDKEESYVGNKVVNDVYM